MNFCIKINIVSCKHCGLLYDPDILTVKRNEEDTLVWTCKVCDENNDADK